MASISDQLNERFAIPATDVGAAILGELESILRIHSLTPEDLSYKWDSYCMAMGADTKLGLKAVQDFKKHVSDSIQRESKDKMHIKTERRPINATPRGAIAKADVFGMSVSPPTFIRSKLTMQARWARSCFVQSGFAEWCQRQRHQEEGRFCYPVRQIHQAAPYEFAE